MLEWYAYSRSFTSMLRAGLHVIDVSTLQEFSHNFSSASVKTVHWLSCRKYCQHGGCFKCFFESKLHQYQRLRSTTVCRSSGHEPGAHRPHSAEVNFYKHSIDAEHLIFTSYNYHGDYRLLLQITKLITCHEFIIR